MSDTRAIEISESALGANFRAEDLTRKDLLALTVMSEREHEIVRALDGAGQRLLIGPRGSGKSTYLKVAYFNALDEGKILPVYVNYSKSITIEPEFRRSASALPLFRQWILAQIIRGTAQSLAELRVDVLDEDKIYVEMASELVSAIERRRIDQVPETTFDLTNVIDFLERASKNAGRRRVVLLLDDAAHAFASEQQREFFEVFGGLRSRTVSSKAAVYPGVTSYTPRFHVGHDAQLIDVWLRPEHPNYLDMMREIAQKRLSAASYNEIDRRESLLDYLSLASFGLPRTLIVMLAQIIEDKDSNKLTSSVNLADTAVTDAASNALKVFTSLEAKLPRYKNFVEVGRELVDAIVNAIRDYNDKRTGDSGRANRILIEEPIPAEVQRIIGFLEYAGVVRQQSVSVSQGERSFRVIVPHFGLLLSRTALGLGRNPSASGGVEALTSKQHTVRVRWRLTSLLSDGFLARCRLDLGACSVCGTERDNPEARFCSSCGSVLSQVSVFEELLDTDIEALPLSDAIISRLKSNSEIQQVKDIMLDEESQVLLNIKYIGPYRASRIRSLAEEFLYE
jgi:hypothetical protein